MKTSFTRKSNKKQLKPALCFALLFDELLSVSFQTIDTYSALVYPSQEENFKVWDIWDERAGYQSKWCAAADSYPEQIEYLKNFLTKRAEWMDNNLPSGEL